MSSRSLTITILSLLLVWTNIFCQPISTEEMRSKIIRIREIIDECACPSTCLFRLKMCLESGECHACRVATYGKRSREPLTYYSRYPTPRDLTDWLFD